MAEIIAFIGLWEDRKVPYVISRDDLTSEYRQSIVYVADLFWDKGISFTIVFY